MSNAGKRNKNEKLLKICLSFLISILCFWWLFHSVEREEVFARVQNVDLRFILLAVSTTFASYVIRAWRWRYFFEFNPPSYYDSFRCLIVGFFMNNVLPARIGEFVRAHLGGRAANQSRTLVLATIAGERLADGLVISLLFAVLFSLGATTAEIERGREIYYVSYLFLLAGLGTAGVLVCRKKIFVLLERIGRVMPGHLSSYTLIRIRRFIQGLEPLLRPSRLVILAVLSVLVWSVELLVYHQVTCAFDCPLTLGALSLFLAAVNFSSLVPAAPGGIGVIEAFATLALVRIGVDKELALAMVAAQHIIQYAVVGIPGVFFFFLRMGGKLPEEEPEAEESTPGTGPGELADISES